MHFHTKLDQNNQWHKTLIEVPEQTTPYYRLYTGGVNNRFKLSSPQQTLFWGCIVESYAGVWLLRNNDTWQNPIIEPITSADIEHYKHINKEYTKSNTLTKNGYWANYFAKSLINSPYSILTQGKWAIQTCILSDETVSNFSANLYKLTSHGCYDTAYQDSNIFFEMLDFIGWGGNCSYELIAIKDKPHEDSARVKWWRKKVKENTCPPVLVWFVTCLDAYIIIDGHSRLRAYQLENKPIELLMLFSYKVERASDEEIAKLRGRMLHGLKCRLNNYKNNNTELKIDHINDMISRIYDNEYEQYITTAKPIANLDEEWEQEVRSFTKDTNIDKKSLQAMIDREKLET